MYDYTMNVFQQLWNNYEKYIEKNYGSTEVAWINEFNQQLFSTLIKRNNKRTKITVVTCPTFVYYTEAPGGYGVDSHTAYVSSHRFVLPVAGIEECTDAAEKQFIAWLDNQPEACTAFFYSPAVPLGSHLVGGTINRQHMVVRWHLVRGETVELDGSNSQDSNT